MARFLKNSSQKRGLPPGSLVSVGNKTNEQVTIEIIDYTPDNATELNADNAEKLKKYVDQQNPTWININGIFDSNLMEEIGKIFEIHPLSLEDIMNTGQRPKYEDFDHYLFVTLKMLTFNKEKHIIESEQVSIIMNKNCVLTFQEKKGDVFDCVRERIRNGKGRIRKMRTDYLAYSLMDAIIDNYFYILESIGDKLEEAEQNLVSSPDFSTLKIIHHLKQEMLYMRKAIWPLRDLVSGVQRNESSLISQDTSIYYRDLHDHTIQVIDTMETYRDMISGMQDVYLSSVSNRMNEVMKILTIFAAIFIPLTFIAGIYGMNFEHMPELKWKWGYFGVLTLMASIASIMILYFKKHKWL